MLFGLVFAWMTTKLARRIYQYRTETSARINLIRDRNYKIRHAVEAIVPVPYPSSQQAIRVIREEADRIEVGTDRDHTSLDGCGGRLGSAL
jgi:hypothetical protein